MKKLLEASKNYFDAKEIADALQAREKVEISLALPDSILDKEDVHGEVVISGNKTCLAHLLVAEVEARGKYIQHKEGVLESFRKQS